MERRAAADEAAAINDGNPVPQQVRLVHEVSRQDDRPARLVLGLHHNDFMAHNPHSIIPSYSGGNIPGGPRWRGGSEGPPQPSARPAPPRGSRPQTHRRYSAFSELNDEIVIISKSHLDPAKQILIVCSTCIPPERTWLSWSRFSGMPRSSNIASLSSSPSPPPFSCE